MNRLESFARAWVHPNNLQRVAWAGAGIGVADTYAKEWFRIMQSGAPRTKSDVELGGELCWGAAKGAFGFTAAYVVFPAAVPACVMHRLTRPYNPAEEDW